MSEIELDSILNKEKLKGKIREKFKYDENKIEGNFILTENAKERIQKLYNQLESNIPIMLEGPTGTSKTKTALVVCKLLGLDLIRINLSSETTIEDLMGKLIADRDNSFSGFTYKKGSFSEAYSEGKVLLLDEVNLAPNPVLQCMLSALDSNKITQSVPGSGLQTFYRHPNFRIIATQNPKMGAFAATRDRLSNKFLETFQAIEFPPFSSEELVDIAKKAAIKMNYIKEGETNTKKAKIINQIGSFHNKWVVNELSKKSPQCYTVRDLNSSVKAISENISPNDVVSCFYGARYEKSVFEEMQKILKKDFQELSKSSSDLPNLPKDFPRCFQSKALKQAFQFAKLGINSGKHLLFVGEEETGLTQIAQWISYYFSKNRKENFIFIFTPETTVSDLLGRYIPAPQTGEIGNIMIWEDGPLTEAIKNGYSCVFTNISSAQTKVAERLNGLFDPKDSEEDYKFDLYENSENPTINISKDFHFISTCNSDKLKNLSPALLNRLMVINVSDQLEGMKENDFLDLIRIILENEYRDEKIDKEIIKLIYENQKVKNYTISKLAKLAKCVYRLYNSCGKSIDKAELINYTHELLYGDKQINKIPYPIVNLAIDLFNSNKQFSGDEKFYFMGSDSLKNLMIILYSCSICRIPVCLVGPTGLGKTSMARAFSEFTRNEVATMYSFNLETQVDDIFGTFTFKNGKPVIIEGPLTKVLGEGSIFIGDEFNLAEDTILQTLAIAFENFDENSSYLIPGINKKIKYNKNFFFISCQNDLSTTGRKKLPHIIEKRLRTFDYPLPDLKDLIFNCENIIKEKLDKNDVKEEKNVDGMRSRISDEYKFNISAEKLANFMYVINNKPNKKYIGNWSMRNIRKILRRHNNQKLNEKSYINVSFELQIMIFILSEVPTEKRKDAFKEVMEILKETFKIENSLAQEIEEVINGPPKIEKKKINNIDKTFLFKGKSGIDIGTEFEDMESLPSLLETLFYAKFANFKEPINFCGPSSYKTFIAKRLSLGADVINLYSETSIDQLLGSIYLVNNTESKLYYLEKILKINGNEEKLKNFKIILKNYFDKKNEYENCNNKEKKDILNKQLRDLSNDYQNLKYKIMELNEEKKKNIPECIYLALESLRKKLFEIDEDNKGIFKDFTSIFKPGILLENILKQSPIILKNLSNLSTAVLERFNDLFNYSPNLTLNEDFCDTFTGEMKPKEINNFSDNFRVISISTLSGIRNLSDAAKSRFTTIYTSEYNAMEKEIAAKKFLNPIENIPGEIFEFIKDYEKAFKNNLPFLDIIKILSIYKKLRNYKNEERVFNLILSIYFAIYSNYDKKHQRKKLLEILKRFNKENTYDIDEFENLSSKINESKDPLEINENILKSKFTEIQIKFVEDEEMEKKVTAMRKNLSFNTPFNKLINYIHFSLALNIPLIIEGQIGIGKKTAIKYLTSILNLKEIYFSISNTTTVEDLFCKTIPIQKDSGLEFKESRSKFLDAITGSIDGDKSLDDCIIILDNIQEASNNVLESLIPVFDEMKDKIFLPNGDSASKRKFYIIAIFDPTSKGTNIKTVLPNSIRNSSLLFKCENFLEKEYLSDIEDKIVGSEIESNKKFLNDFISIYNYSKNNHKKELFNLNDFAKFKKISNINSIGSQSIINYESLLQILLINRFTNLEDLKTISSKLGYLLSQDLWPIIQFTTDEIEKDSHYIKIYPIESKKDKFFIHKLSNYDVNKIEDLKKKVFTLTPEQRLGLIFLMISLKADIPCIIQGPTASGKSYLVKLFCELLGEDPETIILNNDSGINLLTGQIAPKNDIEYKSIIEIKEAIKECKEVKKVYSIFEEDNFLENSKDWKPKDFHRILKELKMKKSELNKAEKEKVTKIEKLLTNELSFLKHLRNEDSAFINALRGGKWVILDGIESAEPELYERLSYLCDLDNKKLNLFEKGPEYEYSKDNKNEEFKINEKFRLFITYNSYEVEQSKKLSSNFISKCLLYSLPQIDFDCKSSALVLSGLFNYYKTFEEKDEINEIPPPVIEEKAKTTTTPEIATNPTAKKGKKNKKSKTTNINAGDSEKSSSEDEEEDLEEENEDEVDTADLKPKEPEKTKIEPVKKEDKRELIKKEIKEIFKKEKKGIILLKKRDVKELSIKLANMHGQAKEFVRNKKIESFAGQKNFSGRSLKYIFNSINIRNYDLPEAIVSVLEDCYSNSYEKPEEMKNELIEKFFVKPGNYNEIMNYLCRDETDIYERYKDLMNIIKEYGEKQVTFKYMTFFDYLNDVALKDVKNVTNEIEKWLRKLKEKNIINEHFIFLRIIYKILLSMCIKSEEENNCSESKINDISISDKINDIAHSQKIYLLFRKLIEKNLFNFNITYKEYDDYLYEINNKEIKNPFYELFTKEDNLIVKSLMLGLLYPELEDDKNIKLKETEKKIAVIILKIINNCNILDSPNEDFELEIFSILLNLSNTELFFNALEIEYSEEQLKNLANDKIIPQSEEIKKKIESLKNKIQTQDIEDLNKILRDWYVKYTEFNNNIFRANLKKKNESELAEIEIKYKNLIEKLKGLGIDDFIERAIKYLEKAGRTKTSLENSEKFVKSIEEEYKTKKLDIKQNKSLIEFGFKPEDIVENFESELLKKEYKNIFHKYIYYLIKYNECLKLVEKIEKNKDKLQQNNNLNQLDRLLNEKNKAKKFKNGLKILRKIVIDNDTTIGIQYFKDILLSNLLLETFDIDNSCYYFNIDNIYNEFNKYISRDNVDIQDKKLVCYLSNILPPDYEIILPTLNINSILLLFSQRFYKKSEEKIKDGLISLGIDLNPKADKNSLDFKNAVSAFQKEDLSKIGIIQGLNKFVDICKRTLFNRDDIKSKVNINLADQKSIINELYNKLEAIKQIKDGGKYLVALILIIKGLYNSCDLPKKIFEFDDLFFVKELNWKERIQEFSKHKFLIYYLFKNPDIELNLRKYLNQTDLFSKNDKKKFPIYTHILRILSSKNELIFQGKSFTDMSKLIEDCLINKLFAKIKDDKTNNLNWIGLLINNTNTEKYLPFKISYLYNYIYKLCEIKSYPSSSFREKFELIIGKLLDFIIDYCFKNKVDDIFTMNINKKLELNINDVDGILYLTELNKIIDSQLKGIDKEQYDILNTKIMEFINNIEEDKNDFNKIYDDLYSSIKNDIAKETDKRKIAEENKIRNQNNNSYDILKENSINYNEKFKLLKENKNLNNVKFHNNVKELLRYKNNLSKFKNIYSTRIKLDYIVLNLPENCQKIKLKDDIEIKVEEEDLKMRLFYFSNKYRNLNVKLIENDDTSKEIRLNELLQLDAIDQDNINQQLNDLRNIQVNVPLDSIKVQLSISKEIVDLKKIEEENNLLYKVKKISGDITEIIRKINNHVSDTFIDVKGCKNIKNLDKLNEIKKNLEDINLENPRFLNEQITNLQDTQNVCYNFENIKKQLLGKFINILKEYESFNENINNLKNDKKIISSHFELDNAIKIMENKKIDFFSFKGIILRSPYISFSKSEKKLKPSYDNFIFDLGNIIPSLYGNSTYSINILSFVEKDLKAEILEESISNKSYKNSFFVSNLIQKNNPLIIKLVIPDKKIEDKVEDVETNLNIKISGLNPLEIAPIVIKNKISFHLVPLKVIIYSTKHNFILNDNKLFLDEGFLKEGFSLKIYFKILNFEGSYSSFKYNYSLISLEDNNIDKPKISLEDEKNKAFFKIKVPQILDDSKNNFHALFSIYFSKNLIIPIEINSKINKRDFGLYFYNNYSGEIQNHTTNKNLIIYKYKNEKIKKKMDLINLYFRVQCNDILDEKDEMRHVLTIKVPEANRLLSFESEKNHTFNDGKTIRIQMYIYNFTSKKEFDELNNYLNSKSFEIEFLCDNNSKKFNLIIKIEKFFENPKIHYCSVPYFIHKNNEFIKLDNRNFDALSRENYIYFNYEGLNHIDPTEKYMYNKIKKRNEDIEFVSEKCKLLFKIKEFEIKNNIIIWGPYEDPKNYKKFHSSNIEGFNNENIIQAKKKIEDIYKKLKKNKTYNKIKLENYGNIETMDQFISYICNESISKEKKIEQLIKLSTIFEDNENLLKNINDLLKCDNVNNLPIIYHNIIFILGNLIKNQIYVLKNCKKNYLVVLEQKLYPKLVKKYNQEDFEKNVKEEYCKNDEELSKSKKYQYDEFSNEPKKINKIPGDGKKTEEKGGEILANKFEIEIGNLTNYQNNLKNIDTINKAIEMIKISYNITQAFPFLIQKINNEEATKLFTSLYSVYDKYLSNLRNIISEDTLKFCLLFESLCKKLKNEVNLDDFEKLKNLENDANVEFTNSNEYPKLKDINIPKNKKWNIATNEKNTYNYFNLNSEQEEFSIQPKLEVEKNYDKNVRASVKYPKANKESEKVRKEEEEEPKIEPEREDDKMEDSDSDEVYLKESEAPPKELIGSELKKFIDKDRTQYIIRLMKNEKKKKDKLTKPDSFEDNETIKNMLSSHSALEDGLIDPSNVILKLSEPCSLNLMYASISRNTQTEKICGIIAIDCCRTIDFLHKCFHAILAFSIINCLNSLEIPYSVVLFADYKFVYTIKSFDTPHNDEIYKLILDCLMVDRYSSRIFDACCYIEENVIHPERSNRRIFLISNGLDPNLKYGELWHLNDEKNKYCFFFVEPDLKEDAKLIKEIWNTFEKDTGIDVVIIEDIFDIIFNAENIYTKFSNVLSEKVSITEEEKKGQNNLNNIEGNKIYEPNYIENYKLDQIIFDNITKLLKSSYKAEKEDLNFYILNEAHKPSNINNKIMEKEINIISHFKIKSVDGDKNINKLTEFEIKGINMDLFDNIFPPNKPSMYCPSVKGTRLYLVGLVKYMITGGQENKIWLEKKACLKRDYRISVIIDSSISCFNNINMKHSVKTVFTFLKLLSLIEIPYFDLIIATNNKPIILSCGNDTTSSLNNKSILWQALTSALLEKNCVRCNLKDCLLYVLNLKSLNLAKKTFAFVLTDGLFDNDDINSLYNLVSFVEENGISLYGIGLGLYPEKIKDIFSKGFWTKNPDYLLNALSVFYGDDISHSGASKITPFSAKWDLKEKEKIEDDLKEFSQNYNNYITYRNLIGYLNDRTFYLETMEETANRDEADKLGNINNINENIFMCKKGYFKGLKVLCCCFWSNEYSDAEEKWIHPDYLKKSYRAGDKCLNDAFTYYGIQLIIKTKYDECIEELRKGGKYYAAWIICGNGTEKKEINSNLVGQFIEVLIKFWKNGGALLFWCDNEPLVYEANLFLKKAEFPGEYNESNIRFVGFHKGQNVMIPGDIEINQVGIFNNKRRFNNGAYERYSLGHNLLKIYEGYTISYAKIKKPGVDLKEEKNDIKAENLDEPNYKTLLPFIPFAYDHEKGLSVIFYPSSGQEGDIIIDGGFSKLFNEIKEEGTYRYILNCIAWTSQFSKRYKENGDLWVENFNLDSFSYEIRREEKWVFREEQSSKDFDIIYLIDATGSMGQEILAAKEQVINILNELKNKYPDYIFNFGAIFYRDKIDSPSDENDFFNLTDNIENLKTKIMPIREYGGGDTPEDWVWGYKTAVENVGWREGTKLIIHIADAGAHGTEFTSGDKYPEQGPQLEKLIKRCVEKNIKIIGFKIGYSANQSFAKIKDIYNKHKSEIAGKEQLIEIYDFKRGSDSEVSAQFKNLVVKAATAAVPKRK